MTQQWPGQKVSGGAEPAPQQQPASAPQLRPILSLPDPQQDRDNARDARDERRTDASIARDTENDRLAQVNLLRKEFMQSEQTKAFREVAGATQQIATLAQSETDTPGPRDIALIISYMKALDPGSVVREGEFATAENAGGVPAKIRNFYNNAVRGGKLPPEVKREFLNTAIDIYDSRRAAYDQYAETYRGLISGFGANPDEQGIVLSQDIGAATPDGQAFLPEGEVAPDTSALNEPEMIGGVPRGTKVELELDKWLRDDITPGRAYLESIGIYPNDEARITAFWNANRGNEALSVDSVRAWYEKNDYPAPTDEDIASTIEAAKSGGTFSGIDTSEQEAEYFQMLDEAIRERGGDPSSMAETAAVSGASGITLGLNDEITGAAGAIGAALSGGDPVGAYQAERDIIRRYRDLSSEQNPGTSLASEITGGLFTGGKRSVEALTRSGVKEAAKEGAKVGAAAGYGYGEGFGGSVKGAALGVPIGAAAGAVGDKLARTISDRIAKRTAAKSPKERTDAQEVIGAADRFNDATGANIQPLPADVGGATTRRATGGAAQTTFGAKPIIEAAERVNTEAQTGIRSIAARQGDVPQSKQAAGEVAIRGAEKAMTQAKTRVDAKYAKARRAADGQRVPLPFATQVAAKEIAELGDTPGGVDVAKQLRDIVGDLQGDYTVEGIKRFRSVVRDKLVKDGLRGSEVEAAALRIVQAADDDIMDGLVAAGKPEAAKAYQEASQAAAERFAMIDDVIAPIIGKRGERSGEQVFAAIERMTRGDAVSLGKFMKALPENEAGSIRGIVIDRLGRATKGRQDADGQAFSLNDFLTRWNDEGLSKEAKGVLFGGETRAALDDLARVAQGTKEAQRYANSSNTAGANLFNAIVNGTPLGAAFYDPATAVVGGGLAVGAQMISGRLLASPSVARWLAKMPKQKTDGAVRAHIKRLDKIAAKETAIAAEISGLQRMLTEWSSGASRVTADQGTPGAGSNTTGSETQ